MAGKVVAAKATMWHDGVFICMVRQRLRQRESLSNIRPQQQEATRSSKKEQDGYLDARTRSAVPPAPGHFRNRQHHRDAFRRAWTQPADTRPLLLPSRTMRSQQWHHQLTRPTSTMHGPSPPTFAAICVARTPEIITGICRLRIAFYASFDL